MSRKNGSLSIWLIVTLVVLSPWLTLPGDSARAELGAHPSAASPAASATLRDTRTVPSPADDGDPGLWFPLVMKRWPPIPDVPVLNPIGNPDCNGYYTVDWDVAYLATSYTLQEDDSQAFSSPTTRYTGSATSWAAANQTPGTYYYRVRATNSYGDSGWSDVQSVAVCAPTPAPPPQCTVYVKNSTGCDLCYEVHGTGIGQRCYSSSGQHTYGTFPSGTYSWSASACCGSTSGSRYYAPGTWVHEFWCGANSALQAGP